MYVSALILQDSAVFPLEGCILFLKVSESKQVFCLRRKRLIRLFFSLKMIRMYTIVSVSMKHTYS